MMEGNLIFLKVQKRIEKIIFAIIKGEGRREKINSLNILQEQQCTRQLELVPYQG